MGGRGPLPTGDAVRRNKPTIPTSTLPASGREDPIPDPPAEYFFGPAAEDWWAWAWRTPQACAWDDGALFVVARRAQLEDDASVLENVDIDFDFLIGDEPGEAARNLGFLVGKLKALAGGKMGVLREMRELDDRLGLTPRGLAANRWKIVDVDENQKGPAAPGPGAGGGRRRLTAV
jgi:hypothetical protein